MSSPISANLMDGWRPRLRQIWEQTRAAGRLLGPSARLLISIEKSHLRLFRRGQRHSGFFAVYSAVNHGG